MQDALADTAPTDHQRPITDWIEVHLQRTDPGREIDDPRMACFLQPLVNNVDLEAQLEVQVMRTELDQEIPVPGAPDNDRVVALAESCR
jgi:hypothetical protein